MNSFKYYFSIQKAQFTNSSLSFFFINSLDFVICPLECTNFVIIPPINNIGIDTIPKIFGSIFLHCFLYLNTNQIILFDLYFIILNINNNV